MRRRRCEVLAGFLALAGSVFVARPATLPRPSPEFVITQPSGAETRLSSFKGRVVAIEFLFVRSPHCLSLAQMLNHLNAELGARGFQPLAVAFGPNADPGVLTGLVDRLKLTYPVGLTTSDKVDAYLGRAAMEVLKIPQIVVVDRNGMIRAASGTGGDPALEGESTLRPLLESLLTEGTPALRAVENRMAAPDFILRDVRGVPVRLGDYRGKVVLLHFWATWCGPCRTEIPWFQEFGEVYRDRGFTVLGVAMDEDGRSAVKAYPDRRKGNYRILLGNEQVARKYGGIAALPVSLLIDREGRVATEHVGIASKREFEREIAELLGLPEDAGR
jgi:cytochrome c biogenesis protein CcmG/thiol:disulfide interchange protein DsbE